MSNTPRFHGTWKGEVLEAVIVEGMETWQEIQRYTKLSNTAIKQALDELLDIKLLERVGDAKYRVMDSETIEEYKEYYQKLAPQLEKPPPPADLAKQPQKKPSVLTRLLDFSPKKEDETNSSQESNNSNIPPPPPPPPPTMLCKTCGVANPRDRNYCGECGETLTD